MSISGGNRRLVTGCVVAVAGAVLAGSSAWWWSSAFGGTPPMRLALVVVVTVSAWLGGAGPGLLATAIGLGAIVVGNDRPDDWHELTNRLLRFGSLALFIVGMLGGLHVLRHRVEQHERALRRQESLLRSFYESSATAMGVVEVVGDEARIVSANAPTGKLFGRVPGRVEGRTTRDLGWPPDRLSAWLERIRRCQAEGHPVRFQEHRASPGAPEWIAATLSPMDVPGPGGGDLCSFLIEDITESKRVEYDLRIAKEQAEAASHAKDRFLAVLSHELRTPLTPVLLAVSSMIEDGPDPAILPALEMIRRNIELESRLIDDLLDLSRIARGRLRLDLEVVDVHRALRRAVEICRDETFVAGLEVVAQLEARDAHISADHARVMQIAWNLVRNAAKFTPAGGRLTIRTSNVPGERPGVERLIVEFADTGIGIEPEILPRIFEAFEQGPDERRVRSQGLGLGLALCRTLAEAMGGRLSAESPGVGRGATFRLEFDAVPAPAPVAPPQAPRAPARAAGPPATPRMRILLVEDNPDTLRYLATVLRGRGHDVVTAETIAAARQAARQADRPFDLLLSDIELPDGTGLQLMREIGGRGGLRGIAMSGFGTEEDVQFSRAAGFLDHLIKPIDPRRLEAALRRAGNPDDEDELAWMPARVGDSGPFPVFSIQEPLEFKPPAEERHDPRARG